MCLECDKGFGDELLTPLGVSLDVKMVLVNV